MILSIYIVGMLAIIGQGLNQKPFLLKGVLLNFPLRTVWLSTEFPLSYPFHSVCFPSELQLNNKLLK